MAMNREPWRGGKISGNVVERELSMWYFRGTRKKEMVLLVGVGLLSVGRWKIA